MFVYPNGWITFNRRWTRVWFLPLKAGVVVGGGGGEK